MDRKESSSSEENDEESEDNLPSDSSNEKADVSSSIIDSSTRTESLRHSLNGFPTKHKSSSLRFSNIPHPQAEWKDYDFGTSFSTASEMSLYQSALDLQDFAKMDPRGSVNAENLPLSTNEVLQGIAEETNTPVTPVRIMADNNADLYFRDGVRRIDFVLAYEPSSQPTEVHEELRKAFETNLLEDGLQLEYESQDDKQVQFVKIHAPWEVLTRYAEIMKIKMPMKVLQRDGPVQQVSSVHEMTKSAFHKFGNLFKYDERHFPPQDKRLTHQYSREKEYLFDIPTNRDAFFSTGQRGLVVFFILRRTSYSLEKTADFNTTGINKLLTENVYTGCYVLHEGHISDPLDQCTPRSLLASEWASLRKMCKHQPLDHIKNYLGVKPGLYFAWLGFYTYMLIPASLVGLICFIYGLLTMNDFIPSKDVCNKGGDIIMCPVCDEHCDFWWLNGTCIHSKISYLFDNPATLIFAIFMSLWSALFLEFWKRYSADITFRWDLTGFDPGQQQPRPEYLAKLAELKAQKKAENEEPKIPFWRWRLPTTILSGSVVLFMISIAGAAVLAVIFYRMSILTALSLDFDDAGALNRHASLITSVTAAMINLTCILILNQVYFRVAEYLTDLELHRIQAEYDDSLTLKMFLLQFVNYYASIFYIAFFKGRFIGRPGSYNRLFGRFRQEECGPGGCLMELSVQLAIIMVGKQTLNCVVEITTPKIVKAYKTIRHKVRSSAESMKKVSWERDYNLLTWSSQELFNEYLEMVLQFGFVTIFVAAFPLAPLFALINNGFEIRLDANKILKYYQRPVGRRVKNIGVWYRILDVIGKLAVVTNAFIIAFTSNFVPRMLYLFVQSEDGTLKGYLNHSLSIFNTSEFNPARDTKGFDFCRYEDYRKEPGADYKYMHSYYFYHVLAAKFAFVVVFENIIFFCVSTVRWLIPDESQKLRSTIRQEGYIINELIVRHEFIRARGELFRCHNPRSIRFSTDAASDRNHLKNALRKRPNSESIV